MKGFTRNILVRAGKLLSAALISAGVTYFLSLGSHAFGRGYGIEQLLYTLTGIFFLPFVAMGAPDWCVQIGSAALYLSFLYGCSSLSMKNKSILWIFFVVVLINCVVSGTALHLSVR